MGDVPEEKVGLLSCWRQFQRAGGEEKTGGASSCWEQEQETFISKSPLTSL